jgi:hypothetical protein
MSEIPTPPQQNVNQHTIARFYLNQFSATSDKKVFVRERGGFAYGPKSTKTLTVEENAFAIFNDGERDNSCDDVNSIIETKLAPHLKSLALGRTPTKEEWNAVWVLTSNFLARSRKTRDNIKEKIQWAGLIAEDSEPIHGMEGAAADINRAADVLYGVMAAQGTESIALSLKEKGCDILVAPAGSTFITSDDPALVYVEGKPALLQLKPGFIERADVEIFMVLKPDIACLWFAPSSLQVRQIAAEEVARRNQDLYDACYKEVFANQKPVLDALTA